MHPRSKDETEPRRIRFWDRCVPAWLAVIAIVASGASSFLYRQNFEAEADAKTHCPIISINQVHKILNHPDLIELTNGKDVCTFNAGPWAVFGINTQHDKAAKMYEQNANAINPASAHVKGATKSFWGAKESSIFLWKNDTFVAIIGNNAMTKQSLLDLAAAAALKI